MILPRLSLLPVLVREGWTQDHFPREPEPDLVMDDSTHVTAYADSGRGDGIMAAANLFHSARISQVIQGCRRVLDLGCGPGTQLVQVASFNPDIEFVGVDLADRMLANARDYAAQQEVRNIRWEKSDICAMTAFESASFDAVISTMTLHHLPSLPYLERCFTEVSRLLKPGGRFYLADFGHLKTLKSIIFFAYLHRDSLPHPVCLDYERSLRAAFRLEDFQQLARSTLPADALVKGTFAVPMMVIVKSQQDYPLTAGQRERLSGLRAELSPKFRRELDELRLFFAMSGLRMDPFA